MTALPYVHDAKHVARVLDLVHRATTPSSVGAPHLEANGFPAPAGEQVCTFLHDLGLLDDQGRPTDRWAAYRSTDDPAAALREIVQDVYAPLVEAVAAGSVSETDLTASGAAGPTEPALVVATFQALCRRADISLTAPPAPAPIRPRREVLRDMSLLLQRSIEEFEQARRCFTGDLPRPAHVAAWNSFVALAFAQLADDDFARLRTSSRRASLSTDDLMRIVPSSELIRILVEHDLVPAAAKSTCDDLLRQRNDCVLPTSVMPDRSTTAAYLSAILGISAQLTEGGAANGA